MDAMTTGLAVLLLMLFWLGSGVRIFAALLLVSVTALFFILDFNTTRIGVTMAKVIQVSANNWHLSAVPLFIFMGEIIFRSDISHRLFNGLSPLVDRIPGRLLHTNIMGCTVFAAVSGSSSATTATVGKMTTEALNERGYDSRLALGSLAGAGSLGLLIPPSIMMIVYGILAEVSIIDLFTAGVLPGLLVAALYSGWIMFRCLLDPSLAPSQESGKAGFIDILRGLKQLAPVLLLIMLVMGGIYSGLATPSEAAALGVLGALIIVLVTGQFSFRKLTDSAMSAVITSSMICSILIAASFLSTTMGLLHLPQDLAGQIQDFDLSPWQLILLLGVFYIVLGFFLDGISITVMVLPITLPLIMQAGFDPVWFGVFIVIMVEMGLITPPVGFNLFVLQGLTGKSIGTVARAALPFFLLMGVAAVLLVIFPEIALWLPDAVKE